MPPMQDDIAMRPSGCLAWGVNYKVFVEHCADEAYLACLPAGLGKFIIFLALFL